MRRCSAAYCRLQLDGLLFFFFFKQKTAYEVRISDWSSDVCSSDLGRSPYPCWSSSGRSSPSPSATTTASSPGCSRKSAGGFVIDRPSRVTASSVEIGRASCRERVCQYVSISVVAVSFKKKKTTAQMNKQTAKRNANTIMNNN